MSDHPKVFISYCHQDIDYEQNVLDFSNKLRSKGIDAIVDLYEESPREGWQVWMERQIRDSDYVLVLNSKSFYEKIYDGRKRSKGISWEINLVYQLIYDSKTQNEKFIPIIMENFEIDYILTPLKPYTYYNISEESSFDRLYWRLRGINRNKKPDLGKLRPLKKRQQKSVFFSSPIDFEMWNNAKWQGIAYISFPDHPPMIGFYFENYEFGKTIFKNWKKKSINNLVDHFLSLTFIIPPFPSKSWILKNPKLNYGKGYFVHIGPNVEFFYDESNNNFFGKDDIALATLQRYRWMDEKTDVKNREQFMNHISNLKKISLIPIGINNINEPLVENNLIVDFDDVVEISKIDTKNAFLIKKNDLCSVVLKKPKGF